MATLLIIGGTGFFGKSILDAFKRGLLTPWNINKVLAMSRNAEALRVDAPELISKDVELINGDIATIDYLPQADFVIHAAASTDASRYLSQGDEERKNIISGTLNYCKLAIKFHKNSKIVFCSSGAVYGYQPESVERLEENMVLGDIERLSDTKKSYAYAKIDSEIAVAKLGELNLNVSVARCFAFLGKYLPRDKHFAIGNFILDGLAGKPIEVKADNQVFRSYMYSDDLVEWLMTIADNSNVDCPIFNVGSEESLEIRDLAGIIAGIFHTTVNSSDKMISKTDKYIPSVDKAHKKLGLRNKYSIEKAIKLSTGLIQCYF